MDFSKLARDAKVPAIAGSIKKNPTWEKKDFDAFREIAFQYCPVLTCSGNENNPPHSATVVAQAADIEHLFVIDLYNRVVASKKVTKAGDELTFDVPVDTKCMFACCTSKSQGNWKSQPYFKKSMVNGDGSYEWEAVMSHEKGACHTAPEKASQWYPQVDRHPELRRLINDRPPLKILYLHGHANNKEIAMRQLDALKKFLPGGNHQLDILPTNVKLTTKPHFASVIDYSPHLVELGLSGAKGYELEGYGHIEAPAHDPANDPTCQTNCEGVTWAKMSKESMAHAVTKLKEAIVEAKGYDVILGFSQGGEVCQQLFNEVQELNKTLETKVKCISLFGARIYHCKYGPVTAKFEPGEMKAFVVMGEQDSEDTKDASRSTNNMWDLAEFKKTYEASGIEVATNKHEGGHEMPATKQGSCRTLFKTMYEFIVKDVPNPADTAVEVA